MKVCAVLLAAGKSVRFGSDKLWLNLHGNPLWLSSYDTLLSSPFIDAVGVVAQSGRSEEFRALAPEALFVVEGGEDRQTSSRLGVHAVPADYDIVLVHDAARPFLDPTLIERVVEATERIGAAFPALAVTDTLKTNQAGRWTTPDRSSFVRVQTPQGALRDLLVEAHGSAVGQFTDEASLIESLSRPIEAVEGDVRNVKVTHVGDLERMLGAMETRTGFGYDVHAFSSDPSRPMWLGGIEFDDRPGLEGHSDADVLLHAIVDALLGAASLGDIGVLFPNTDPSWKNSPSAVFLQRARELLSQGGWQVRNIDATVIAERPKVMVRKEQICSRVAELVGVQPERVSVKATTNEGLGALGRGEGIAAMAVATIERAQTSNR